MAASSGSSRLGWDLLGHLRQGSLDPHPPSQPFGFTQQQQHLQAVLHPQPAAPTLLGFLLLAVLGDSLDEGRLNVGILLARLNVEDPVRQHLSEVPELLNLVEKFPEVGLDLAHGEEVEQNDVVELEALRLVDGQTEHRLHEVRKLLLDVLVAHYDHLRGAELRRHTFPLFFGSGGPAFACAGSSSS
eukprot:CAMPEP_0170452424 /NCGR_PEP_ID=MMETSP0123-20130129/1325_1 /TAXON_ID=182087 /ORGANISM="Favella ehrenbergii, Strain Fehren 1" /LENGTH=186 /DNA_ID=CAMNT_0010714421 /DNA_START=5783 /DNA_END=6344 /DNA_ORIENTATION=+